MICDIGLYTETDLNAGVRLSNQENKSLCHCEQPPVGDLCNLDYTGRWLSNQYARDKSISANNIRLGRL